MVAWATNLQQNLTKHRHSAERSDEQKQDHHTYFTPNLKRTDEIYMDAPSLFFSVGNFVAAESYDKRLRHKHRPNSVLCKRDSTLHTTQNQFKIMNSSDCPITAHNLSRYCKSPLLTKQMPWSRKRNRPINCNEDPLAWSQENAVDRLVGHSASQSVLGI